MAETPKLKIPKITGNMTWDVVRDLNAVADAVDSKVGVADGLATLGADGKVPANQLDVDTSNLATKTEVTLVDDKLTTHTADYTQFKESKGQPNGIASLDENGLILKEQMPSVDTKLYHPLFIEGDEYDDITGGWVIGHSFGTTGSQQKTADSLNLNCVGENIRSFDTLKKINFDKLTTISTYVEVAATGTSIDVGLHVVNSVGATSNVASATGRKIGGQKLELDVSNLKGGYHVRVYAYSRADNSITSKFYRVWGE